MKVREKINVLNKAMHDPNTGLEGLAVPELFPRCQHMLSQPCSLEHTPARATLEGLARLYRIKLDLWQYHSGSDPFPNEAGATDTAAEVAVGSMSYTAGLPRVSQNQGAFGPVGVSRWQIQVALGIACLPSRPLPSASFWVVLCSCEEMSNGGG